MNRVKQRIEVMNMLLPPHKVNKPVYLDIGIGDATITLGVAQHYGASKIYGATNIANTKIKGIEIIDTSDYIIRLPNESVDLATAFMSLHHIEPKHGLPLMIDSLRRVCKKGAYFFVRDHDVGNEERIKQQSSFKTKQQVVDYLNSIHIKYGDDPLTITYWDKFDLCRFIERYGFKHLADYNYPLPPSRVRDSHSRVRLSGSQVHPSGSQVRPSEVRDTFKTKKINNKQMIYHSLFIAI